MDQAPQDQELRNIIDKVYFKLLSNGGVGVSEVLKVITGVSKYWNSICAENDYICTRSWLPDSRMSVDLKCVLWSLKWWFIDFVQNKI